MDELDILKKDWNSSKTEFKSYSDSEIVPMLHKKSSSIVKTLFYISVAELGFWILMSMLPYFLSDDFREKMNKSYEDPLFLSLSVLSYLIIFLFIYLLYTSYKSISTTDNAKKLMKSILKTRKIIKYYVLYNLCIIFLSIPLSLYHEFQQNSDFHAQIEAFNNTQMLILFGIVLGVMGVFVLIIWLFYRLIYGILLRRLNRNYKELKKIEV